MERQSLLNNWIVIGIAYLVALLDIPLDFAIGGELIEGLAIWIALLIKIGAIFIAAKVFVGNREKNRDLSVFSTPFIFFMIFIQMIHFGSGIIERFDYNCLVVISVPWFYYYHHKDDQRNNDEL